ARARPSSRPTRALCSPPSHRGCCRGSRSLASWPGSGSSPSPTQLGRIRSASSASLPSSSPRFPRLFHPTCCPPPSRTPVQRKRTRGELAPSHGFAERWLSAETVRVTPVLCCASSAPRRTAARRSRSSRLSDVSPWARIMAFRYPLGASECVRGRLPLLKALRNELGPLLLAPA